MQPDAELIIHHRVVHYACSRAILHRDTLRARIDQIIRQRHGRAIRDGNPLVAAVVQLAALDDRQRGIKINAIIRDVVDVIIAQHRRREHVLKLDALIRFVDVVAARDDLSAHDVDSVQAHVIDFVIQYLRLAALQSQPHQPQVADDAALHAQVRVVGNDALPILVGLGHPGVLDRGVDDAVIGAAVLENDSAPRVGAIAGEQDRLRRCPFRHEPPALHAQRAAGLKAERRARLDGQRDAGWHDDVGADDVGAAVGRERGILRQRAASESVSLGHDAPVRQQADQGQSRAD